MLVLDTGFREVAQRTLQDELDRQMVALIAAAEPQPDGSYAPAPHTLDPRLETPRSGVYAEIHSAGQEWRSPSTAGLKSDFGRLLSGGERNRVHLARILKEGANVLLLDEPTNDLDVNTMRALEEALENFAGCAVVISHDRWFLDRVATHILAFEGESRVVFFDGNYSEYEADRKSRLGAEADQPHRIRYRHLTR